MKISRLHSIFFLLAITILVATVYPTQAQIQAAPPALAATLAVKIAAFEKTLSSGKDLVIYVVNAPDVARELRKTISYPVGKGKVAIVVEGASLPAQKPDIIFIGGSDNIAKVILYARQNSILTICSSQEIADAGATLMLAVNQGDGKPYASISATASKEEHLEWNPAIFKIVRSVK